jgi:hypothetical protein
MSTDPLNLLLDLYNQKKQDECGGFISDNTVNHISSITYRALSNIKYIKLLVNNRFITWLARTTFSAGIWLINKTFGTTILTLLKKFAEISSDFIVNGLFNCNAFCVGYATIIMINNKKISVSYYMIKSLLSDKKMSDGFNIYNKIPFYTTDESMLNGNTTRKIWYPKILEKRFFDFYLESLKFGNPEVFDERPSVGTENYYLNNINPSDSKDGKCFSTGKRINIQNVYNRTEYKDTEFIIIKYLTLSRKVKINMDPLVIVYKGPPGVGKSLFLDYMGSKYNMGLRKFIIDTNCVHYIGQCFKIVSELFEVQGYEYHIMNIDELDKLYFAYINTIHKDIKNPGHDFLDKFFAFVNQISNGKIILLTLNDDSMFRNVDKRHEPLVNRMIFKELGEFKCNEIKEYIKFYNTKIIDLPEYNKNIDLVLSKLNETAQISARTLTHIMVSKFLDFDKTIDEINLSESKK